MKGNLTSLSTPVSVLVAGTKPRPASKELALLCREVVAADDVKTESAAPDGITLQRGSSCMAVDPAEVCQRTASNDRMDMYPL